MEGLIVKQPFADLIIDGQKEWELRSRSPPNEKIKKELFLLSSGMVLGKIKITNHWELNSNELLKNQEKHCSSINLDDEFYSHVWEIQVTKKYSKPKKYGHPMGARVWVKNVTFDSQSTISQFA